MSVCPQSNATGQQFSVISMHPAQLDQIILNNFSSFAPLSAWLNARTGMLKPIDFNLGRLEAEWQGICSACRRSYSYLASPSRNGRASLPEVLKRLSYTCSWHRCSSPEFHFSLRRSQLLYSTQLFQSLGAKPIQKHSALQECPNPHHHTLKEQLWCFPFRAAPLEKTHWQWWPPNE